MADIKYEITEELGVLSEKSSGWTKELNRIPWNGGAAKFDIRDWAPEHEKMEKASPLQKRKQNSFTSGWANISDRRRSMKLIHLSDLHIGKRVNEFSMIEDQKYILNQILEIIREEEPDAVLIAGEYLRQIRPFRRSSGSV